MAWTCYEGPMLFSTAAPPIMCHAVLRASISNKEYGATAVIPWKNCGSLYSPYGETTPALLALGRGGNQRHIAFLLSCLKASFSKMPGTTCLKKITASRTYKTPVKVSFQNNLKTDLKKQINPIPASLLIEMFFSKPRFLIPLALLLLTQIISLHPSVVLGSYL